MMVRPVWDRGKLKFWITTEDAPESWAEFDAWFRGETRKANELYAAAQPERDTHAEWRELNRGGE